MQSEQNSTTEVTRPDINLCIERNIDWLDRIVKAELSADTSCMMNSLDRVAEIVTVYVHMIEAESRRHFDI